MSRTYTRTKDRERAAVQAKQSGNGRVVHTTRRDNPNSRGNFIQNIRKIEEDDGNYSVERVNKEVSRRIQQARTEKGLTQKELGVRINEKASVIQQYEQGTAIPSNNVLRNLERILDVKLRGLNKGNDSSSSTTNRSTTNTTNRSTTGSNRNRYTTGGRRY
eukprot:TRINITY_DN10968_c0_g1_i1.p1 TRINITY_DN10968_c0_g1~~TRINITY_DN10968_c0_g1_i1.p1  ORF type:complete len:171 (+),score=39.83 TRINITY_DN10968_c0_g1_i1:31-513(+)